MWYALVEISSDYHVENRMFFGEEVKDVAAKVEKSCDQAMQFDLEEMTMDEIDSYYTEGYDEYEALSENPSEELLTSFQFQCNDTVVKVLCLAEGYDALVQGFDSNVKGKLRGWNLPDCITEDEWTLNRLDTELQKLDSIDPEKLEFFKKK